MSVSQNPNTVDTRIQKLVQNIDTLFRLLFHVKRVDVRHLTPLYLSMTLLSVNVIIIGPIFSFNCPESFFNVRQGLESLSPLQLTASSPSVLHEKPPKKRQMWYLFIILTISLSHSRSKAQHLTMSAICFDAIVAANFDAVALLRYGHWEASARLLRKGAASIQLVTTVTTAQEKLLNATEKTTD